MEIDEFVETETGEKTLKSLESIKKELEENWGYSAEELNHIEHLFLNAIHDIYNHAEKLEEEATFQSNNAYKYRKLLLQIADIVGSTVVEEEAKIYSLPQEIIKLKDNTFYKD